MTADEWKPIFGRMVRRWPHVDWAAYAEQGVADQMFTDLFDLDATHVEAATDALARDGLRFPPSAGEIRQKVVELAADAPDWGEVSRAIYKLAGYPTRRFRDGRFVDDRAERLRGLHPVIQEFVAHVGWAEAQHASSLDRTAEAQTRERYRAFVRRRQRDGSYQGIAPGGLAALERVNREPRQLGDALVAALGPGGPVEEER